MSNRIYGFVHCALEDLVRTKYGVEAWEKILKKSRIRMHGGSFLMHRVYADELTLKLVQSASEVLGLSADACLEALGCHFLYFCQQHGYDHILRVLGSNLTDFLTNLDNLHDHLASTYPGMSAPSFRVSPGPLGSLHLHYCRSGDGSGGGGVETAAGIVGFGALVLLLPHGSGRLVRA
ncbi:hypothetical protein HPB47_009472 [Ixodes persulcatus]|uniref:Uncharacterized protein n=1 Tax=Ixodes persulcatus TaxID=34615 RepID=A0AC60P206_IXOPE|nr:hypothetical protein HPB47_009472 [Ixodes persulcatus]